MVRRFRAGIPPQQLQQEEPIVTTTTRSLTQEELIQQQIIKNQIQIQPLQEQIARLEKELIHRHSVNDSTTIRFLNAEKSATLKVIAALQQGMIVDPQQADTFIKRSRDLISFTFDPKPPTQQEQISLAEQQGLKAIYRDGKLVGFEDAQQKISVGVEHAVETIGKERLERAGFKITETTTTRQLTPQEQMKVQAWSDKFKMTPTPETIQKIISKPTVTSRSELLGDLQVLQGVSLFGGGEPREEITKIREQIIKNKLKRFVILMRMVQDTVHSAYLRALGGAERRTLRQHIHVSETRGFGGVPQTYPTTKKQSKINPMNWFGR